MSFGARGVMTAWNTWSRYAGVIACSSMLAVSTCDNQGRERSSAIAACGDPRETRTTGPRDTDATSFLHSGGGTSSSANWTASPSNSAIALSSRNEMVLSSRGASMNSCADLTTTGSAPNLLNAGGLERAVQKINLTGGLRYH